jgi:riboflavin kinase/FMN adenylyltransferase
VKHYTSLEAIPAGFGPSVVTFGKFDGLHIGHRSIVERLSEVSRERGLVPTVLTFDRNPLSILDPARCPESVTSRRQRRELLEGSGVDTLVELAFDRAFSEQSAEDFVDRILVGALRAQVVLVGTDTRFGLHGRGDFSALVDMGRTRGFEVQPLEHLLDAGGTPVSSTRVRQLLAAGDVTTAAELLGRRPSVRAMVVHGEARGRELGYPTANLAPDLEGFIPADGVYAGFLILDGRRMPSAISIGNNPTFQGVRAKQIEAHVIDEDIDLYDRVVELEFVEFIRGMVKYESLDALIRQIGDDTDRARTILDEVVARS